MNISETEQMTGLLRANIRFYEKEGLIHPKRLENGYRDYSKEDGEQLKKIRLLRELNVPIEKIKEVTGNSCSLCTLLKDQKKKLEKEIQKTKNALEVCTEMLEREEDFSSLSPEKYLCRLEQMQKSAKKTNEISKINVTERDRETFVPHPVRRFLARNTDMVWWGLTVKTIFCLLGIRLNSPFAGNFVILLLSMGLMVLSEGVFLHFFSATPGKWLFGIRVRREDGSKLTVRQGIERTWQVLWQGMGGNILWPVTYWRMYKSRKDYLERESCPWDFQNEYTVERPKAYAVICVTVCLVLSMAGTYYSVLSLWLLPHHSPLTVKEFSENYNQYLKSERSRMGNENPGRMDTHFLSEQGQYLTQEEADRMNPWDQTVVIDLAEPEEPLILRYEMKENLVKKVSFEQTMTGMMLWDGYMGEARAITWALSDLSVWDQSIFHTENILTAEKIGANMEDGLTYQKENLKIQYRIACQDPKAEIVMIPDIGLMMLQSENDDAENIPCTVTFSAERTDL